jgi:hypothetical protein
MNEKAIKELYWEFRTRGIKLNKKLSELEEVEKKKLTKKLRELSNLVKQLSVKAEEKGIDLKDKTGITVVDDASDDWTQLLGISSLPKGVKGVLKAKIENLGTIPTANQMNNLLKFCEKYYTQNITKLTKERAIKSFEKNKGTYTNQDIDRIITDYKKAAKVTLSESIKKLDTSFQLQMAEVQPIFDSYHSGEKVMEGDINNDWKIQIKESDLLQEIKQALEQKITTLATPPTPKQMRILLGNMNKYYQANVGQVNEAELIKTYEQHEGRYTDQDLDGIAEKHKKAAISAIMGQIDRLGTDFSFNGKAAHDAFVVIYKGGVLDAVTAAIKSVPHQFKIDRKTIPLGTKGEYNLIPKGILLKKPTIQISMKGTYAKSSHAARQSTKELETEITEWYTQELRNTITIGNITDILKGRIDPKVSTNIVSGGFNVALPGGIGSVTAKIDLANVNWLNAAVDDKGNRVHKHLEMSLGALRLQFNINLLKLKLPVISSINLQHATATVAVGGGIGLSEELVNRLIKEKIEAYNKKKLAQAAAKKILQDIQKGADDLVEEYADDFKDILEKIEKKNPITDKAKEAIVKYRERAKKLVDAVDKLTGGLKDRATKVLVEAGERFVKRIGPKLIGRIGLKAAAAVIPGVGAFFVVLEVGMFMWSAYEWYSKLPATKDTGSETSTSTHTHRPHPGKM